MQTPRADYTADAIMVALKASDHDVARAARLLDVTERTLQRRMAALGIRARVRYEVVTAEVS
jgi:transcriptional regulator with GAF, ATPase, and Fis domain